MKKNLSKQAIMAIAIVGALVVAFAVFLPLYLKNNEENRELYKEQKIKITAFGEELGSFTIEELLALEGVAEEEFTAIYDTSVSDPVEKAYSGIEVKKILLALGVELYDIEIATFKGSDGLTKIYEGRDIRKDGEIFIAYKVNGQPFTEGIDRKGYTRDTEDGGPFVSIKASDAYSQNRCKLLTEVNIE